jgi:hypothetical protein
MGDGGRDRPQGRGLICPWFTFLSFNHSFVRGARTPRPAHSAMPRVEDLFYVVASRLRADGWTSPLCFLGRISLRDGWMALSRESNKKNSRLEPGLANVTHSPYIAWQRLLEGGASR